MPARSAALASWIARTSFCVIAIRRSGSSASPHSTYENVRPSATTRGERSARSPCTTPSRSITPARYISATTSMIPDPQMPVTPVLATFGGERGIVRPHVDADHLEPRLERDRVDAHALDRARGGALTRADLRALERRSGRARRRELLMPIAEHDLGVGADVDEQLHVLGPVRSLRQDRRPPCRRRRGRRCTVRRRRVRCGSARSRSPAGVTTARLVASVNGA